MNNNKKKEKMNTLKRAIKKGDVISKSFCWFLIKLGYSNRELQAMEIRNKKYSKLTKKYNKYIKDKEYYKPEPSDEGADNVWICWFQGIDNAPLVVRQCVNSIKENMKGKKIHIITEDNMFDFVEIPQFIIDKWHSGTIAYAHISDILRTELLLKYGGVWIDATTFMSDSIPDYVYKHRLFLLHFKRREDLTININSWFIFSEKNNRTLQIVRDLLYIYWKQEKRLSEYFLWHMFVKMAFDKYPEDYESIQYISEEPAHYLYYNLFRHYDESYWQIIKQSSFIHKVSYYKFCTPGGTMPENISGTYYEKLIKGNLS